MADSRIEAALENILGAHNELLPPESRNEKWLHKILGEDIVADAPQSRIEELLKEIYEQGSSSVEVEPITITENGVVEAPEGKAYSPITTDVSVKGVEFLTQDAEGYPLTVKVNGITKIFATMFAGDAGDDGAYKKMTHIELPNNLVSIGRNGFTSAVALAITNLPNGITEIGDYGFANCTALSLESLPASLTTLGISAFQNCSNLAITSLPSGIHLIKNNAFSNCTGLTKLKFLGNINAIQSQAFRGCGNIIEYDFTNNTELCYLQNVNAFQGINANCKIVVPDNLYNDWIGYYDWSSYASYIVRQSDYTGV